MPGTTTKRDQFLKRQWERYPLMPEQHDLKGRVLIVQNDRVHLRQGIFTLPTNWIDILRPGDWISAQVEGSQLIGVCLLAPCLNANLCRPSIEQWQEHQEFQQFLDWVNEFFLNRKFHRVQTPTLVPSPGTEPFLDVFSTDFQMGKRTTPFFLPTSQELHMKKIMAACGENIFEIRSCFRNGEISDLHQPEFLMLEWYRCFSNLKGIQTDVEELIAYLCDQLRLPLPEAIEAHSMQALFQKYLNFELKPTTSLSELRALVQDQGLYLPENSTWDDLFFLLFLERIESHLDKNKLIFVKDYPPSQAALARLTDEGWGDRFEVYWQGMELANAFHELNDPILQRLRFQEDISKKKESGRREVPIDEEFLQSLESGMPPSAGIAMGIERLFMALKGIKSLEQVRLFSIRNK